MIQQILFISTTLLTIFISYQTYSRIISNIKIGRDYNIKGNWKTMVLVALGQSKMFKNFLPALFHLFIYVAFIITQIELIEIMVDGFAGMHRSLSPYLGGFYTFLISTIEILSVLAFVATIVFLSRRNILKVQRFHKPEMKGWPFNDGNLILLGEILLITGIFTANSSDLVLQTRIPEEYHHTGRFFVSSLFADNVFNNFSTGTLKMLERGGWWLHVMVVFGFIVYLTISKHLHLIFSFINTYFAPSTPRGKMENMPVIMNEVKSMMGFGEASQNAAETEIPEFGANDLKGLTWKNILDAYTCTECGRCTAACPANQTGKKLSPRKIMMDVRDRAEETGNKLASKEEQYIGDQFKGKGVELNPKNFNDGKSLFDYISDEEIYACTTCNACVEECPVMINPLDIIMQLRRYRILNDSAGPSDWMPMFTSLENSGSVWQMQDLREQWTKG
jgi:heterodisulfide reductase subunit C